MKIETELYVEQVKRWPTNGNYIMANYDNESIVVYQAYKPKIAEALVKAQNFHSAECVQAGFSLNRMTWIKTNFLWMMFRCGWATKSGQERVLAIRVKLNGFDQILADSVVSTHNDENDDAWKRELKASDVRLQWDPDHLPNGDRVPTNRRAIQLGLRGAMLMRFSSEFILAIEDITEFVLTQSKQNPSALMTPVERPYEPKSAEICKHINLSKQ